MTTVDRHPGASHAHEVAPAGHGTAAHKSARPDLRARLYRNSLFRHTLRAWHPSHSPTHAQQAAAQHLHHLLGGHGSAPHGLARHEGHGGRQHHPGGNATPRHRQPNAQPDRQPRHKQQQQQQQPRHAKSAPQTPKHEHRKPRHPMHGSWGTRRDATASSGGGTPTPQLKDGGSHSNGGRDAPPEQVRRRADAIRRVAAVVRTELQALAARTADQPLIYPGTMREAVIRQRCAGHDPLAVATDAVKARQQAGDDARSSYDDLQSFLADFKRLSAGTGARGALTPLFAFHDLRPSTPSLRARSLVQLEAITLVRSRSPGDGTS